MLQPHPEVMLLLPDLGAMLQPHSKLMLLPPHPGMMLQPHPKAMLQPHPILTQHSELCRCRSDGTCLGAGLAVVGASLLWCQSQQHQAAAIPVHLPLQQCPIVVPVGMGMGSAGIRPRLPFPTIPSPRPSSPVVLLWHGGA